MRGALAVRRETKSPWERRSPVTPDLARKLAEEHGLQVIIQPSARRVFHDKEYVRAGATVSNELSDANVILGVKEIPTESLQRGAAYVFFSHVIKGQRHNMPMLARLRELGCTLIDYELIRSDEGRRLIFFGRYAGIAGMVDTLWALGQRLRWEGVRSPFESISPAHTYDGLDDLKREVTAAGRAIQSAGLPAGTPPLVIGIAGYGNVAQGAREVLSELPVREVEPDKLAAVRGRDVTRALVVTTFREEHLVEPSDARRAFVLEDYYAHPDGYRSVFARHLPFLTVLVNCNYWDQRYPRLVTKADLRELFTRERSAKLKVIGDIGCDIEGAIECTVKTTDPSDPVYVFDPATGAITAGIEGSGPVILAVDILPAELPRDASEEFSRSLAAFLPALANADFEVPFEALELPAEVRRAVILHRGRFTPEFESLASLLEG
jgi:alpha-aminoadipic semialdehyde synthase